MAFGRSGGKGNTSTDRSIGSTRTMAFNPLSVTHGAPSGPTITPWGRDPAPSSVCLVSPVSGSSHPRAPKPCAVYQTPPSLAGATSWGRVPAGSGKVCDDLSDGVSIGEVEKVRGISVKGMGSFVGTSLENSRGAVNVGAEVDGGASVSASSVGVIESAHPRSARRERAPMMSEFTRREMLLLTADLSHFIKLLCCKSKSFWCPILQRPSNHAATSPGFGAGLETEPMRRPQVGPRHFPSCPSLSGERIVILSTRIVSDVEATAFNRSKERYGLGWFPEWSRRRNTPAAITTLPGMRVHGVANRLGG